MNQIWEPFNSVYHSVLYVCVTLIFVDVMYLYLANFEYSGSSHVLLFLHLFTSKRCRFLNCCIYHFWVKCSICIPSENACETRPVMFIKQVSHYRRRIGNGEIMIINMSLNILFGPFKNLPSVVWYLESWYLLFLHAMNVNHDNYHFFYS